MKLTEIDNLGYDHDNLLLKISVPSHKNGSGRNMVENEKADVKSKLIT